jgi:hypothetical protein
MGLDTSHGCWHGAYSEFHRWRQHIAVAAGLPPLELMKGFYGRIRSANPTFSLGAAGEDLKVLESFVQLENRGLPISWDCLRPDQHLYFLLSHSDCDGQIPADICGPLADRLEQLLPLLTVDCGGHIGDINEKTRTFIDGLRKAHSANEAVEFH